VRFQEQFTADRELVEEALRGVFRGCTPHADIYDAMNYSLLAGGKRLRPILTIEACRLCGGTAERALPFACAVEMIHTYSLIHDDLPCMDNDELRRGKPTNHMVFGEATAVLAGDGLLTAAFETMLEGAKEGEPLRGMEAALCLARAAGAAGMVGGQILDMAGEGRSLSMPDVEELQQLKTGALIAAAAEMGGIIAGAGETERSALRRYAQKLGLAFQIRDDMLDVTGDTASLGKPVGSDAEEEKTTFVTLKGLEECGQMVERLTDEAVKALDGFADPWFLRELALVLVGRTN
jgi:geranylgeranyl diphosphate synthase type II